MYQLLIEKQVTQQLSKIAEPDYSRLKQAILSLADNPRPAGYKKLKGKGGYRIRQGDFRIIYEISDKVLTVYVLELGHRKDVYD